MSVTGGPAEPPVKTGPSVVDNLSAMAAVATILGGLHRRRRTGRGVLADLALYDVATWLTAEWWPTVWSGLGATARGDRHPYVSLENSYPSADGGRVAVSCRTPDQVGRAARLLGLADDPAGWDGQVAAWVAARTADEAAGLCQRAGVPAARHRDIPAVVSHPLLAERDLLPSIPVTGGGDCRVIGSPYRFLGEPPARAMPRHAPALGEHTATVLRDELAYSETEIAMLGRGGAGVTGSPGRPATADAAHRQ
jgi:crotonobetainyl-CoA:carnitine CoA-transferase CaiB-like acyl-CoA transferase